MARGFAEAGGKKIVHNDVQKNLMDNITKDSTNIIERDKFEVTVKKVKKKEPLKNTTLCVTEDVYTDINTRADRANDSVNNVVNEFIDQFFDRETNKFKIEIDDSIGNEDISVRIPQAALMALKTEAKKKNMKIGEYFSKLYIKAIEG